MKVIIAGSRTITDPAIVAQAIEDSGFTITEVVSGAAKGVDTLGEQWARKRKIPVKRFPAQWWAYGKKAGALRNEEMGAYADAGVVVWDGNSRGSGHMIYVLRKLKKRMYVKTVKDAQAVELLRKR